MDGTWYRKPGKKKAEVVRKEKAQPKEWSVVEEEEEFRMGSETGPIAVKVHSRDDKFWVGNGPYWRELSLQKERAQARKREEKEESAKLYLEARAEKLYQQRKEREEMSPRKRHHETVESAEQEIARMSLSPAPCPTCYGGSGVGNCTSWVTSHNLWQPTERIQTPPPPEVLPARFLGREERDIADAQSLA